MKKLIFIIYIYLNGILVGFLTFGYKKDVKQPEIKPCSCITYSQYALWSEKYNRYVSENKPDSVAKYAELLNRIK